MKGRDILIFGMGLAVGAVATHTYLKKQYEQIIKEEVEQIKEVFGRNKDAVKLERELDDNAEIEELDPNKLTVVKSSVIENKRAVDKVTNYCGYSQNKKEPDVDSNTGDIFETDPAACEADSTMSDGTIYVIPPEEFGVLRDFDMVTLLYYKNGVLTDDYARPVPAITDKIPKDFMYRFDEYNSGVVYSRNSIEHTDYEILLQEEDYEG